MPFHQEEIMLRILKGVLIASGSVLIVVVLCE